MKTASFYTTVIKALKQLKKGTTSESRIARINQYLRDFKEIDASAPAKQKQNFASKAYKNHYLAKHLVTFFSLNSPNITEANVLDYLHYKLINSGSISGSVGSYLRSPAARLVEAGFIFRNEEIKYVVKNN